MRSFLDEALESEEVEIYDPDQLLFDKKVLTSLETAKFLKISPRTLSRMVKRGEVPFKRLGRQLRFSVDVLERWIKEGG
jgi:excisionase family DNA binding protein